MGLQAGYLGPGKGATKRIVEGPGHGFGYQSAGVRAGGLLWISGQYAPANAMGDAAREADAILGQLAEIARNGGADLSKALRVRAIVKRASDAAAVYAALKKAVPKDPPAVTILVAAQLPVPAASLTSDAVVHAE